MRESILSKEKEANYWEVCLETFFLEDSWPTCPSLLVRRRLVEGRLSILFS